MFEIESFVCGMIVGVIVMTIITSALIALWRVYISKENKDDESAHYADSDIERWR